MLPDLRRDEPLALPRADDDVRPALDHLLLRPSALRHLREETLPAIAISSDTEPIPLLSGSSHSKKTRGRRWTKAT
jgi:hypothetical protein